MICKNCGEQIPENSKFCLNCGNRTVVETPSNESQLKENEWMDWTGNNPTPANLEKPKEEKEHKLKYLLILSSPLLFLLFLFWIVSIPPLEENGNASATSAAANATQAVASSESVLSPRQQQIRKAFEDGIQWDIEDAVKDLLKNPNSAEFTHNKGGWTADNAIFTGDGTVQYTNASGNPVSEPFTVSVITNNKIYFSLYVKLGDNISVDDRKGVNSLGLTTKAGESIFGIEQSHSIFENDAADLVVITDEFRQNITLAEFNRIETGMRYEDVTETIGSFGFEQARSEVAGYQTVIIAWDGNGSVGANANVTFSNGQVMAKAQVGLQ